MSRAIALAVAIVAAVGCDSFYGLKHWDTTDGGAGGDGDAHGVDAIRAQIAHIGAFAALAAQDTESADLAPTVQTAGDVIPLFVGCQTIGTVSRITVTGSGAWTWSQIQPTIIRNAAAPNLYATTFGATAPVSGPTAVSVSVTATATCTSLFVVGDEFGVAPGNTGTVGFDTNGIDVQNPGSGECGQGITTGGSNDAVWAACIAVTNQLSAGFGFTAGAGSGTTSGTALTEYQFTTDPATYGVTAEFMNANAPFVVSVLTLSFH